MVEPDNVAREVSKQPVFVGGNIGNMDAGYTPFYCNPELFPDNEPVMLNKLLVSGAIAQVVVVAAVLVQPGKRWAIYSKVDGLIRKSRHYFAAIAIVNGVFAGNYLLINHDGVFTVLL